MVEAVKEFEEKIIALDRVTRVVKGGRRFRFRATVVVGNGKDKVGVGVGKGQDVQTAIAKAVSKAKKAMITVDLKDHTIPHETQVTFGGATVFMKPASAGTGVIAGGAVRSVVEAVGIKDLLTKSLGSTSKINNAYATQEALATLGKVKAFEAKKPATKESAK
jgi:small subunit ribosomal protein S5